MWFVSEPAADAARELAHVDDVDPVATQEVQNGVEVRHVEAGRLLVADDLGRPLRELLQLEAEVPHESHHALGGQPLPVEREAEGLQALVRGSDVEHRPGALSVDDDERPEAVGQLERHLVGDVVHAHLGRELLPRQNGQSGQDLQREERRLVVRRTGLLEGLAARVHGVEVTLPEVTAGLHLAEVVSVAGSVGTQAVVLVEDRLVGTPLLVVPGRGRLPVRLTRPALLHLDGGEELVGGGVNGQDGRGGSVILEHITRLSSGSDLSQHPKMSPHEMDSRGPSQGEL